MVPMSKIAQQLCDDIVEPAVSTSPHVHQPSSSKNKCKEEKSFRQALQHCPMLQDQHGNATRSVIIEKQKVVKNLGTGVSSGSKIVLNKHKSKEFSLKKDLIDIAINTVMTGSLRSDNHCNTVVRHRDNADLCKCGGKRTCTRPIKPNKTFSRHLHLDKAVAQAVETASCGTQFLENVQKEKRLESQPLQVMATQTSTCGRVEVGMQLSEEFNKPQVIISKKSSLRPNHRLGSSATMPSLRSIGPSKRWAVTRYPTLGPDF